MGTVPPHCSHNRRNDHHNRDRFRVSGLGFGQSSVPGCLVLGEPFLACVRQRTLPVGTTRELVPFWMWAALSLSVSVSVCALRMFHVMLSDHLLTALQQAAPTRSRHKCCTCIALHWNIEIAFRSTLRASHIPLDHKSISRLTVSNASLAWVCSSSSSFPPSICRACYKKHK